MCGAEAIPLPGLYTTRLPSELGNRGTSSPPSCGFNIELTREVVGLSLTRTGKGVLLACI